MDTWYSFFYGGVNIIKKAKGLLINEQINIEEAMVIGPKGEKVGIKKIKDALILSNYAGLDLVLLNPEGNPPICKIMDYNKFVYEKKRQEKENKKKQRETNLETKEYRMSVSIDENDIKIKAKNASKYLEKGHRVKGTVRFKGREMAHPELGGLVLKKFAEILDPVSLIEKEPVRDNKDGRFMNIILAPKKEK